MPYRRPEPKECPKYYFTYIDEVPPGDIINLLRSQISETVSFLKSLPPELGSHAYANGKWTICEVIGHMIDCERIFAYRGLRIARNDKTPMPGFEQDDYVAATNFSARSIESLAKEFEHLRSSTVTLFEHLTDEEIGRSGTASGGSFTTRSFPYIILGHELHHVHVLRTRYV